MLVLLKQCYKQLYLGISGLEDLWLEEIMLDLGIFILNIHPKEFSIKKKINKIKIIKTKEPLMCSKCNLISFEDKISCSCYRNKKCS